MFDIPFDDPSLDPEAEWEAIEDLLDNVNAPDPTADIEDLWPSSLPEPSPEPVVDLMPPAIDRAASPLVFDVAQDILEAVNSWFTIIDCNEEALVAPVDLAQSGTFDAENNCIVMGDVTTDLAYIDRQTGPTCSLMAQEQFVERYINHDVPEAVLEWRAESWGCYEPSGLGAGTNWVGQAAILEHFDIPHSREMWASVDELDASLKAGNDIIIGVDARAFYQDPMTPTGAGHAVTIIGWGVDPSSMETTGYYIADSNFPGTARFLSPDELERCWQRDMISVAPPKA